MKIFRRSAPPEVLVLVLLASALLFSPWGCSKKSGPEAVVEGFLGSAAKKDAAGLSNLVNLESLFPVYEGERIDSARTRSVTAEWKDSLLKYLADRDKAFWEGREKKVDKVEQQADGGILVVVRSSDGTRRANFLLRHAPERKENFLIFHIFYNDLQGKEGGAK